MVPPVHPNSVRQTRDTPVLVRPKWVQELVPPRTQPATGSSRNQIRFSSSPKSPLHNHRRDTNVVTRHHIRQNVPQPPSERAPNQCGVTRPTGQNRVPKSPYGHIHQPVCLDRWILRPGPRIAKTSSICKSTPGSMARITCRANLIILGGILMRIIDSLRLDGANRHMHRLQTIYYYYVRLRLSAWL